MHAALRMTAALACSPRQTGDGPLLRRLYKQVCLECAAVVRGPDGGLQTKNKDASTVEPDAPVVEEVRSWARQRRHLFSSGT